MGAEHTENGAGDPGARAHEPEAALVALALGSNQDRPERRIRDAIAGLDGVLESIRVAPLFRTRPVSSIPQPDYLNTAVVGCCRLTPEALLAVGKKLEHLAGRRLGPRFGPRPLDVDLLLYGDLERHDAELTLPHPHLRGRRFYLAPLAEIGPSLTVPPDGAVVGDLLAALPPEQEAERIAWSSPPRTR